METTVSKQTIIAALQQAHTDYHAAMQITSRIGMDLHLGSRHLYYGLCYYFVKYYPEIEEYISEVLSVDKPFPPYNGFNFYPIPRDIRTVEQLKSEAIAPRLELLNRTIARLQKELQPCT